MVSRLKNPIRYSIKNRTVDFSAFDVNIEKVEMHADQLYLYWKPPICSKCSGLSDTMHNWDTDMVGLVWTCPEHTPEHVESEAYCFE